MGCVDCVLVLNRVVRFLSTPSRLRPKLALFWRLMPYVVNLYSSVTAPSIEIKLNPSLRLSPAQAPNCWCLSLV